MDAVSGLGANTEAIRRETGGSPVETQATRQAGAM